MASTASAQTGMTGIEIFSPLFALLIELAGKNWTVT